MIGEYNLQDPALPRGELAGDCLASQGCHNNKSVYICKFYIDDKVRLISIQANLGTSDYLITRIS